MLDQKEEVVRENIRIFIATELIRDKEYPIENDESLINDGLIDSFSLAELAVYVNDTFGVYIPDADLTVAKMDTLDQIITRIMQ